MDDRIAEIQEACDQFRKAFELKLSFDEKYWLDVMEIAARDWVDLLDSDTLIIRWCEEHRSSPHPDDVDQENCPVWSWEMEYRPTPPPCRMVKARLVALASFQGGNDG